MNANASRLAWLGPLIPFLPPPYTSLYVPRINLGLEIPNQIVEPTGKTVGEPN